MMNLPTRFMSPETLIHRDATEKTEAYTCGCFLYQLFTFNGVVFGELNRKIGDIMQTVSSSVAFQSEELVRNHLWFQTL